MASLFGKNKLRSEAEKINTSEVIDFIEIVKKWHHDYHHGSLKADKETSREQAYNQDFFIRILGYEEKPAVPYSLEPKATTEKGQLPDAVLSYTNKANGIENIAAVVELKGASIPLDRPQRREGNMSPVQQGFKYKTQYRNCPFVIVSNFYEFRLYHDNQLDYELWTLDDLVNPEDDYLLFKTWYTLLRKDHLVSESGQSKTEQLLSDIRVEQENIGKKFYKVYKEARIELIRDIYRRNTSARNNVDVAIQKAQKIIDRIVFAAFAEDRGLLPDNTLHRVIASADNSLFGGSLWNALKGFFEAIDKGSPKLEIPDGYNGGLFKFDPELDSLQIDDAPLRTVVGLGTYNFAEDLSVNILGHIFEQSISDIEEIKNKVNESQDLETLSQSRRKKDGIFYTPDYIVRYIVDNSLGAYLREHEEKFKEEFGLKGDILDKTYEKRERQAYTKYQDFLQNVKVVDPACGSGAFLVYVFDYLLAENQRVGDILGMTLFSTDTYVRDILRNNIYGVDLNEESVEITKLSLWLKTAQKGKKLTALDQNIKCGNSLIDDPEVAGDKAFNWQKEFPEIFAEGGFDVVVGNPPYVSIRGQDEGTRNYLKSKYRYSKGADLYVAFIERGLDLLRSKGRMSLICPNKFFGAGYGKAIRGYLADNVNIFEIWDVKDEKVFQDALISTIVINIENDTKQGAVQVKKGEDVKTISNLYDTSGKIQIEQDNEISKIIQKLDKNKRLKDFAQIRTGIMGFEYWKMKDVISEELSLNSVPLYTNGNLRRYEDKWESSTVDLYKLKYRKPTIELNGHYLNKNTIDLFKRHPKIIVRGVSKRVVGIIDNRGAGLLVAVHSIVPNDGQNIGYMLAIINSNLTNWYHLKTFYSVRIPQGSLKYPTSFFESIPYIDTSVTIQKKLDELQSYLTKNKIEFASVDARYRQLCFSEFDIEKWPKKVDKWWTLDFVTFIKGLNVKLPLNQKDELFRLFEKYQRECVELDKLVQKTDYEINQLVYRIYDLTPEEVARIESA